MSTEAFCIGYSRDEEYRPADSEYFETRPVLPVKNLAAHVKFWETEEEETPAKTGGEAEVDLLFVNAKPVPSEGSGPLAALLSAKPPGEEAVAVPKTAGDATPPKTAPSEGEDPATEFGDLDGSGWFKTALAQLGVAKTWSYANSGNAEGNHNCTPGNQEELVFSLGNKGHCKCNPLECTHEADRPAFLFGSMHLLTLAAMKKLLIKRKRIFAVVYRLGLGTQPGSDIAGSFGDFSFYNIPADRPCANLTRTKGLSTYSAQVDPHQWVFTGMTSVSTGAFRAKTIASDVPGCRALFEITFEDVDLTNPNVPKCYDWEEAVRDATGEGKVTLPPGTDHFSGVLQHAELQLASAHTFFGYLVAKDQKSVKIIISKSILAATARKLTGVTRDASLYKAAVVLAGRHYGKLDNLPETLKGPAVIATAVLALSMTVDLETESLTRTMKDNGKKFEVHAVAVGMRTIPYDLGRLLKYVSTTLSLLTVGYYTGIIRPMAPLELCSSKFQAAFHRYTYQIGDGLTPPDRVTWRFKRFVGEPMTNVEDLPHRHLRAGTSSTVFATSPERDSEHPFLMLASSAAGFIGGMLGLGSFGGEWQNRLWTTMSVLKSTKTVHPLPPGSVCPSIEEVAPGKWPYDAKKDPIEVSNEETVKWIVPKLLVCGIALDGYVPYHFRTGSHLVERSMLENRCFVQRDEQAYDANFYHSNLLAFNQTELIKEVRSVRLTEEIDDEAWLSHFPSAKKRTAMRDALKLLRIEGLLKNDHIRSVFVKLEKSGFITLEGVDLSHPRHIVGGSAKYLAATGPSFWAMGNAVKRILNEDAAIYYGSNTAESVGRAFENQVESLGGFDNVIIIKGDASRMDAHVHEDTLDAEDDLALEMGVRAVCMQATAPRSVRFYTVGGLTGKIVNRRVTGDAKTSVGNTLEMSRVMFGTIRETCHLSRDTYTWVQRARETDRGLCARAELGQDFKLMINGDDSLAILRRAIYRAGDVDEMRNQALRLGYRMKFELAENPEDVEFCSRVFWPTKDGLVLGAKIGRWMYKAGYMFESAQTMEDYRSQMIGHLQDNSFVPLVSDYCRRILELLPSSNKRARMDDDYKIHAERTHEATEDTFIFAYLRYGITRHHISEFRAALSEICSLPAVLSLPWLETLYEVDQ